MATHNSIFDEIVEGFKTVSEGVGRELQSGIEQGVKGTFLELNRGEDIQIKLAIGDNDASRGCCKDIWIPILERKNDGSFEKVVKNLKIKIPAGVSYDTKLKYDELGDVSRSGGRSGDLYIIVVVPSQSDRHKPSNIFDEIEANLKTTCEQIGRNFNAYTTGQEDVSKTPPNPVRGEDLQIELEIGFDEAILGCIKEIQIQVLDCQDNGEFVRVTRSLKVTIPAGVNDLSKLRLKEQGDASKSYGQPGDLYVCLRVPDRDNERKRNGLNIESEIKITTAQSQSGCELMVKTIFGERKICVSPGTKSGDSLVLSGFGIFKSTFPNKNGDHIIRFKCE
ncbi:DnaJ C-terminal domain-containing protein [Chamaesiphon sp. VAR_48_metabat_403]|uniref:DnaJ C-terminal domain-containing protein n=1 Tax=Chamaesiphon sp. VAR_48_metabat_403 TaxID=2964700 RepID=UPI00286E929A|nr:DnaJ C-terminal domain-containing protein [Chamaesiphon sp. VAR_48_metabat_403]